MSVDLNKGVWHDHEAGIGGGVLDLVERETNVRGQERFRWLEKNGFLSPSPKPNGGSRIVAEYDYVDANGELKFQVCRLEPKSFRQRRPDGNGGWIWNLSGIKPLLYRLPEIIEAVSLDRLIMISEGEKDADRLWSIGVPATCNSGGANKWRVEHGQPLAGADVVVIPDNDQAGQDHAQAVAHALKVPSGHCAAIARRVRLLDLKAVWPEAQEKGDISDWLNTGKTAEDPYEKVGRLPDWTPSSPFVHPFVGFVGDGEFFEAGYVEAD